MKKSLAALAGLLKRFWVVAMVTVAVLASAAVVSRLRTFFDSDKPYVGASLPADVLTPINTKRVTYEIIGPPMQPGGSATSTSPVRPWKRASPRCPGR